jgi:hypothetical protein
VWASDDNRGGPTLTVVDPAPLESIAVTITDPGMPSSGTWTSSDSGAKGTIFVASTGVPPPSWDCAVGSSADQGSYTMDITIVSSSAVSNGAVVVATGTITGTLEPVPMTGSTGTVSFTATF